MQIMQNFLSLLILASYIGIGFPCALPYWWSEQYHFPPFYPSGQPKSTYKYVETFHQSNPNNYVRVQEYSEYTWWEHDTTQNHVQNVPNPVFHQPDFVQDINNVVFSNDGRFHVFYPHNNRHGVKGGVPHSHTNNIFPRGNRHGVKGGVPHSNTNNIFPRGDNIPGNTNNMIPSDKTDRISPPSDTNNRVPATDSTSKPTTTTTTTTTTSTTASTTFDVVDDSDSGEREINENENFEEVTRIGNIENDLETGASSKLQENTKNGKFLGGWFGTKKTNETEPCKVSGTDIHSLRSMIENMFSFPREHRMHADTKEKAREDIINKFRGLGLQVWTQNFTTPPIKNGNGTEEESREGVNLVGVIPGSQRGHLEDEIVLVGAHYDTVADSNGVDDNGSGLAVMLEVARAITEARCRLNHTLMFVAFDHEENGAMGSNYFVDHYLIPEELKRARGRFQGAFILDGIMNYNDIPNTQELPLDYTETLPGLQYFVNNTGNRGNFLAMISRDEMENKLSQKLMDAWQDLGDHQYKLFHLAVDMGNEIPSAPVIEKHLNFLRSDHATFWYHNSSSHFPDSLKAVLLTDTGPFRGQMKECYHHKCDDLTVMSPEKLQFAKKTADALTHTLVELTKATALGNQIEPMPLLYVLHAFLLCYAIKVLFH